MCNWNPWMLRSFDVIISCFVITPLTILWWAGTWQILDIYLYPQSPWISYWISLALGSVICTLGYFINPLIARLTAHPRVLRLIIWIFNYIFSFGLLNFWRGVWQLGDPVNLIHQHSVRDLHLVSSHPRLTLHMVSIIILALSEGTLILLRASGNVLSLPFGINTEIGNTFHFAAPRFRSQITDIWWYIGDVLVTQFLVCPPVIAVWRGVWTITTQTLSPDYDLRFHVQCALVGMSTCLFLHCINYPLYKTAVALSRLSTLCAQFYEVVLNAVAGVAGLLVWVACWQMLKEDVLGLIAWRSWLCHASGFVGLLVLHASSTLAPVHCVIDGEWEDGSGVWWNIQYVKEWRRWRQQQGTVTAVRDDDDDPLLTSENPVHNVDLTQENPSNMFAS